MTSFLSKLISKSLGQAPVLHPRPVSRFESQEAGGILGSAQRPWYAAPGTPETIERADSESGLYQGEKDSTAPARITSPQRQSPNRPVEKHSKVELHDLPSLEPAPSQLEAFRSGAPQETAGTLSTSRIAPQHVGEPRNEGNPAEPAPVTPLHPITVQLFQESSPAGREAPGSSPDASGELPSTENQRSVFGAPGIENLPRLEAARSRPMMETQDISAQPGAPRVVQVRPSPVESSSSPAARPTIRVTIGRIEVRAALPPASEAKPAARPGSKMSLDEYLRSRPGSSR